MVAAAAFSGPSSAHEGRMKVGQPRQASIDFHRRFKVEVPLLAPPGKSCCVEILQDQDDLVGPGLKGQARRHSADVETLVCVPLVPRCLDTVGVELSLVGAVSTPATGMGALVRPADVLHDHTGLWTSGLWTSIEVAAHDLPVAAPKALNDLGVHDRPGAGGA
jgi:hypothetical protein